MIKSFPSRCHRGDHVEARAAGALRPRAFQSLRRGCAGSFGRTFVSACVDDGRLGPRAPQPRSWPQRLPMMRAASRSCQSLDTFTSEVSSAVVPSTPRVSVHDGRRGTLGFTAENTVCFIGDHTCNELVGTTVPFYGAFISQGSPMIKGPGRLQHAQYAATQIVSFS